MNRTTLQQLSAERLEDASVLLAAGRWSGAYYLAGYALECALKSCVLAHIEKTGIIFLDKRFAEKCWTHEIEILVEQAGLRIERDKLAGKNQSVRNNWLTAKDWTEISRYEQFSQQEAENLFDAINNASDGVLQWLKNYW